MSDFSISVDLLTTERNAEKARRLLHALRKRYDVAPFEFTREVRIAPNEIPHSHPILTLNTFAVENENRFLSTYLHEQIHWYLTDHREEEVARIIEVLKGRYPDVPSPESERARSVHSIYLHLVVNWLEIEATGSLIGRDKAIQLFDDPSVYRWIYGTVIKDWDSIGALLKEYSIAPMPDASQSPKASSPVQGKAPL